MKIIKKYLFLITILILGFIFGIIFIYLINDMDKLIIKTEISEFINKINKDISFFKGFGNSFLENFITFFIIWCSGFIFLLVPVTYFICFYKGFVLGFLFSTLIYIYNIKGSLLFIAFVFPSEIISIIFLLLISNIILKMSKKFLLILLNKDNYDLRKLIFKYFKILVIIILVSLLIALTEVCVNYFLIKIIV